MEDKRMEKKGGENYRWQKEKFEGHMEERMDKLDKEAEKAEEGIEIVQKVEEGREMIQVVEEA